MGKLTVLIVEDDRLDKHEILSVIGAVYSVDASETLSEAKSKLQSKPYDVVLLDKRLPDGDGLSLLPFIKTKYPETAVIILTCDSHFSSTHEAMDSGATDYVIKGDTQITDLLVRIPKAKKDLLSELEKTRLENVIQEEGLTEIVGRSHAIQALKLEIQKGKGTRSATLITGESGTGKDLIARRINEIEGKKRGPFITMNCGAIPENLVESELFGYVRGAFTGANGEKRGLFQAAHRGDLFLDEIGDFSLSTQVKLLRAIQEKEIRPLGSEKTIPCDVRVICATNKNLEEMVEKGLFREDLLYRIDVLRFRTVPLRERMEDVPDLAQFFLRKYAGAKLTFSPFALELLCQQSWPGNVRQLQNWIERVCVELNNSEHREIRRSDFYSSLERSDSKVRASQRSLPKHSEDLNPEAFVSHLQNAEKTYLEAALKCCNWNVGLTAERIGRSQSSLYLRCKELDILTKPSKLPRSKSALPKNRKMAPANNSTGLARELRKETLRELEQTYE